MELCRHVNSRLAGRDGVCRVRGGKRVGNEADLEACERGIVVAIGAERDTPEELPRLPRFTIAFERPRLPVRKHVALAVRLRFHLPEFGRGGGVLLHHVKHEGQYAAAAAELDRKSTRLNSS